MTNAPDDYLTFETAGLADFSQERLDEKLTELPDLTVNHLQVALALETMAANLDIDVARSAGLDGKSKFNEGYAAAYRDLAAHLRQCDFLPGGDLLTVEPRNT